MTDLPHIAVGDPVTEEHWRIFEAYLREHDLPVAGARITEAVMNRAIDWWNAIEPDGEGEKP